MSDKAMPVFASGMYISDNGDVVINADEMDAAGVRKLELIEVKPTEAGSGEDAELEAYMKSEGIEVPEEGMVCLRCGGDCMGQIALTPEAAPAEEVKE